MQLQDYQISRLPNREIGGWLLVLCAMLLIWQPISAGLVASSALDRLAARGFPVALILVLRILVTGLGVGAGLALLGQRSGAVALTKFALVASAATDLFVYLTPYFPNHRAPGETPLFVVASLTYHGSWLAYLFWSKRVKATFR